ncbi:MAG: YggT family protein [Gammaproteobacteria bacterium]|nr:YggT family protein [Gammaproteobacteria bacterium]MDH5777815.1 YggT family protein [Gammaproteobacteria bacterium]
MGGQYLSNAGTFLIETLFGLYILFVMLRFLLQIVRADMFDNQISQALIKITNPALKPFRKIIPGIGGIDWASVILMIVLKITEIVLKGLLPGDTIPAVPGLFILAIAELLALVIGVFLFCIFLQIIISWINPGAYNPIVGLIHQLTEPLMRPARRIIKPVSGLDLSPMLVIIVLYLLLQAVLILQNPNFYLSY